MGSKDILILGAGPAGMACAMELYKEGRSFTIVEKDRQVGGLAKTYRFGEFRTDNGPHRFYSQNRYLYSFIENLLGEKWIKVDRFTRFYIQGKFYMYPVQWKNALGNIGVFTAGKFMLDMLVQKLNVLKRQPRNFEEYAVNSFGRGLAELNVLNYTEKAWGLSCTQLSVDWAQQRIKGLSVRSLIMNTLFKKKGPKTLVDQFYYPDMGTGTIYETIMERIKEKNPVLLENEPVTIIHDGSEIREVILKKGEKLPPEKLISSIPITELLSLLKPAPPDEVMQAAKKLRYRSQVYLFITVNKPSVSRDQWIYFPDKEVPFGRISEMRNFSKKMSPEGKTSLFVEFFCWEGDETWNKTKERLFDETITWLDRLGLLRREEVIEVYRIRKRNVYPVYDLDYKNHLAVLKDYLDRFSNLIYIGRPGRFRYTNQDHSLEMGILAARSVIENRKYDLDKIGAEQEYFERGYAS